MSYAIVRKILLDASNVQLEGTVHFEAGCKAVDKAVFLKVFPNSAAQRWIFMKPNDEARIVNETQELGAKVQDLLERGFPFHLVNPKLSDAVISHADKKGCFLANKFLRKLLDDHFLRDIEKIEVLQEEIDPILQFMETEDLGKMLMYHYQKWHEKRDLPGGYRFLILLKLLFKRDFKLHSYEQFVNGASIEKSKLIKKSLEEVMAGGSENRIPAARYVEMTLYSELHKYVYNLDYWYFVFFALKVIPFAEWDKKQYMAPLDLKNYQNKKKFAAAFSSDDEIGQCLQKLLGEKLIGDVYEANRDKLRKRLPNVIEAVREAIFEKPTPKETPSPKFPSPPELGAQSGVVIAS